jgi:hypothetical protein
MNKATFVRQLDGFNGDARLYRCDPSVHYGSGKTEYVVVSGVAEVFATETYIFPANADGAVIDWGELDGSFKGYVDHKKALSDAGYTIT